MKLAIICGSGYISGKEIMALELAGGLKNAGHDIDVATTLWGTGEFGERLRALNIQAHPMRLGYISATPRLNELRMTADQLIHLPALYSQYRRFLRDVSPNKIIHTNWQHLLLLLPFLNRERDLFWVHEIIPDKLAYRKLFRHFAQRLGAFVAVSNAVRKSIINLGVSPEQVIVIHNGISPFQVAERAADRSRVRIGIVGQVGEWKGHEDLIEAFADVAQKYPQCELHIFGDATGSYSDHLRALIAGLNLSDRAHWQGFESDRSKIYSKIDICVVPSRFEEPFGLVAVEAAMAGLPCIATRRGGLPEIVQDQITGLLVESENPGEVAHALKKLAEDSDARGRMGEAARQVAHDKFSRERLVTEFADLLEK